MPRLPLFLPALLCLCVGGCSFFDVGSTSDLDINGDEVQPIRIASDMNPMYASDPFEIREVVGLDTLSFWTDPSAFVLTTVGTLKSDTLALRVAYGGGCAEHQFRLYGSSTFKESNPAQNRLTLVHDDGGDTCKALISEELRFDLTPLRELYQQIYERGGIILLRFYPNDRESLIVRYEF